jgi:hypothetical protein
MQTRTWHSDDQIGAVNCFECSPIVQVGAGSIPAQDKHLCARTCLFVLNLGVFYVLYVSISKNTNLKHAYFEIDNRECECLK